MSNMELPKNEDTAAVIDSVYSLVNTMIKTGDDVRERLDRTYGNLHQCIDSKGATLLHYSVESDNISRTRWLVCYGLDVNAQTKDGTTPLMVAVKCKSEETVCFLLKANAKILIANNEGNTVAEMLSVLSIDLSQDYFSITGAIMMKLIDKCETEEEAAVKLFNAKFPLYLIVYLKNSKVVKYYLDQGVDVNLRKPGEELTALHMAVHFEDWESVKLLLDNGADVSAKDLKGRIPIMYMRECQNSEGEKLEVLKMLDYKKNMQICQ